MSSLIEDKLTVLASDEHMIKAIKSVIDESIKNNKPEVNKTDDDTVLGQKYRASEQARNIIDEAFKTISGFKEHKKNNLTNKER